jgi:hypothetical protein
VDHTLKNYCFKLKKLPQGTQEKPKGGSKLGTNDYRNILTVKGSLG